MVEVHTRSPLRSAMYCSSCSKVTIIPSSYQGRSDGVQPKEEGPRARIKNVDRLGYYCVEKLPDRSIKPSFRLRFGFVPDCKHWQLGKAVMQQWWRRHPEHSSILNLPFISSSKAVRGSPQLPLIQRICITLPSYNHGLRYVMWAHWALRAPLTPYIFPACLFSTPVKVPNVPDVPTF